MSAPLARMADFDLTPEQRQVRAAVREFAEKEILPHVERVVATGDRAAELGLRLAYGGFPDDRLEVLPGLEAALDRGLELVEAGTELVVLPTYTAMLALRGLLVGRGLVRPYWEGPA